MDLDFILTVVVYLLVIMYIHYMIKEKEPINNDNLKKNDGDNDTADKDDIIIDSDLEVNVDEKITNELENKLDNTTLIIDENEINEINNGAKDDFLKYLNIEDYDKGSNYQQLLAPLQDNTIEVSDKNSDNELDKYFSNIKDEQYNFNPVPTESRNSDDLMADKILLNTDTQEVFAFDDFDNNYSNV